MPGGCCAALPTGILGLGALAIQRRSGSKEDEHAIHAGTAPDEPVKNGWFRQLLPLVLPVISSLFSQYFQEALESVWKENDMEQEDTAATEH